MFQKNKLAFSAQKNRDMIEFSDGRLGVTSNQSTFYNASKGDPEISARYAQPTVTRLSKQRSKEDLQNLQASKEFAKEIVKKIHE